MPNFLEKNGPLLVAGWFNPFEKSAIVTLDWISRGKVENHRLQQKTLKKHKIFSQEPLGVEF